MAGFDRFQVRGIYEKQYTRESNIVNDTHPETTLQPGRFVR